MWHNTKKILVIISLIFSLNFFGTCYAFYIPGIVVAEAGVGIGVVGLVGTMFSSMISSLSKAHEEGDTTIELYENVGGTLTLIPADKDIVLKKAPATQTFVYKNVGSSSWLSPSVSWQTMFDDPDPTAHPTGSEYYVALTNNNCSSMSSISAGESCTFNLVTYYDHPGDWGTIKVTGDNLLGGTQFKNVLAGGGLEITINFDPADYHLGYRSIKLTNTIPDGGIHISSITPNENLLAGTDPVVKYCSPTDPDCAYKTTCNLSAPSQTISLASGVSCLVWFKANSKKANNITDIPLQTISAATGRIKVTIEGERQTQGIWEAISDYEKDSTFKTTYSKSLYVGGGFTTAGGTTVNRIAKWDGSNWSPVISDPNKPIGVNDQVLTFASINSDLYVGGLFTTVEGIIINRVVKWDGSNWSALGSGTYGDGGGVDVLTTKGTELYAGGTFIYAGGVAANHVAKWDGTAWSNLGSGTDGYVYALTNIGNHIYVGGLFANAGGNPALNIADWDTNASTWSALGTGLNTVVWTLTSKTIGANTYLYAGGGFTSTGGGSPLRHIATWSYPAAGDGTLIAPIAALDITGGHVYKLLFVGTDLYVGGEFTSPASKILKWTGASWSALVGPGEPLMNNFLYALASISTDTGTDIYAGGSFTTPVNKLGRWNGTNWSALGSGINDFVRALTIIPALAVTDYAWPGA